MDNQQIAELVIFYVVFLFSTTVHEAAHAWAAMLGGDLTAYHGGQVSLDPRPHIRREPYGMVLIPILGLLYRGFPIGFASTPYDPYWALRHPKRAALMALAGPISNLLLAVLAGVALRIGVAAGQIHIFSPRSVQFGHLGRAVVEGSPWGGIALVLGVFFSMNLLLFVLNLLPVPPLDGSGVLPLILSDRAAASYQSFVFGNPGIGLIGMAVAWIAVGSYYYPILRWAVGLLHPGYSYS
jgi:Zn-dependent protease